MALARLHFIKGNNYGYFDSLSLDTRRGLRRFYYNKHPSRYVIKEEPFSHQYLNQAMQRFSSKYDTHIALPIPGLKKGK